MKLAETRGVTYQIAKIVRKSVADCHIMYRLLKENASLGKLTVVVEDGIRITKCPPGYARGVYPQRSVGHKP